MGQKTLPVGFHIRPSPPLITAALDGQKSKGGVRFLVLQTCCYAKCKRPNNLFRFGSTFGPDPAPGGPVFTFRTFCYHRYFEKSLYFRVQKKGPVGFAILPPPRLGLADFQSQCGRAGDFLFLQTCQPQPWRLQNRRTDGVFFLDPEIESFTQKTFSNRRSEK